MNVDRMTKRELIVLAKKSEQMRAGLAAGRRKGADVQRLAASLRQQVIARAVRDLLEHQDTARWRADAMVKFIFERQQNLGFKYPYSFATIDRRVRHEIRKCQCAQQAV